VALIVPYLRKQGVLSAISSQVRFARRRFGNYEVIDFVAVLIGYATRFNATIGIWRLVFAWCSAKNG
jgi:hypothetical protein